MSLRHYRPLKPGRCPHCKDGFDLWHKTDNDAIVNCPKCGIPVEMEAASTVNSPTVVRKPGAVQAKNAGFTVYKKTNDGQYEKQ